MATFHKYKKKGSTKDFWEYRIYYQDPITRKTREKSKKGFTNKAEAKLAAEEIERQLRKGHVPTDESLKSYLETWLNEYKKGSVAKNTFSLHQNSVKNHIVPYFNNILLKDVKPVLYQKFINNLTEKGYSRRTVEIVHGTMYNAMKKAIILEKISKNPCDGVEIKIKKKDPEIQFIESEHISRFLQEAYKYDYIYWIFYKTLIETGMRKGEAAALQWTDVDLKEKTININKSLDFREATKNSNMMFGDTKNYNSKRIITISQGLANDLHFHQKYQNQNKLALNDNYHFNLNLVLCRNDGNYMPKSSLFNSFSRILKKVNLPPLPIHSLRHTHAVLQLEAGVSMKYLQERLGHGSMQITSDVYSHISKKLDKEAMNKFEEHMRNVLE
ncbi:tyrosine-type recombinase/integrase [Bacillus pseudomycoides]|uniref:tyrosine-type recombinase/integrase n=1 Tax=Bacillus pseudomycoides TaxID=64104 RepID=UPI000BEE7B26|nr:tyrosine-type recombinase/integrase [Bacillus pseudomycoides]PED05287.1 site-specific integrase [Bacillus pseudomycoides]PEK14700.1 site-specific integrase [Bacillus pseudomycoides]PEO23163.1 site-specific integrase [Bacillus pseudomycoides]PEP58484.1 site-specific integrase [Bacillus pseudomycoides]PFW69752.1 site-specific integrase [Bacillus pseudomycoides]